jgi:hypothetical protein
MTYNKYADGALAWGECRRSGKRVLRRDMVEDDQIPGMLVARDWYEPRHPQEFPISVTDPEALWKPSPENVSGETAIAALGAAWSPAAVPETLDRGVLTTTTYTLTGSGGYVPYSYQFLRVTGTGSANFSVVQQGVNTFKIRSLSTTPYAVYNLTVLGTVVDFLGQQVTAALNLVLTLASPLPATLALYITQLAPRNLWKWNEAIGFLPDTINDTGSVGNVDLTMAAPTSWTDSNPGPDTLNSTKSMEFDTGASTNVTFTGGASAMGSSAIGSFVFFLKRTGIDPIATHSFFITESAPVTDKIYMSVGGLGGSRLPEIGFVPTPGNGKWFYTTADPFTTNNTWQCVVFVQDGVSPKIYVNGTLRALSTGSQGTSAPDSYWFANETNNFVSLPPTRLNASSYFYVDRVLTPTEISNLMTYLPTP